MRGGWTPPPAERDRAAVLELVERTCCRRDGPEAGVDRHAGVCHCAAALADGSGTYLCPEVAARLMAVR